MSAARPICNDTRKMVYAPGPGPVASIRAVIYCVVPEPLADELYDRLAKYYEEDPNVTVIVDRRKQERRDAGSGGGMREIRDLRRMRITGDFPPFAPV